MRTAVYFEGRRAGSLDWRQESGGVRVVLDCELCSACILRVYAETEGAAPLYVGLPEPQGGRLRLARRLSAETLRQAGWTGKEPLRVYLAERQEQAPRIEPEKRAPRTEPPPRTGDAVLDALIEAGAVSAERTEDGVCLSCPFSPHEPFALAPAFVLCRAEQGRAVLDWKTEGAAEPAAPSEMD